MKEYSNYNNRNINGVILLNKPVGISSNNALQRVKRLFCAKKAGHVGSLDLLASGMLPICLGEATKFSKYLLDSDKRYLVKARLGERTTTSDTEGEVISIRPVVFNKENLNKAIKYFCNLTSQVPPMFSALKYNGQPLYKYARKGIVIPRKPRFIRIYEFRCIYWNLKNIKLEIYCSKGTYIRTLIDDFGEYLGCGAHVIKLHRLAVSQYSEDHMIKLEKLEKMNSIIYNNFEVLTYFDKLLLPIESIVMNIPAINLSKKVASLIRLGQTVQISSTIDNNLVRMTEGDMYNFFGIGKIISPGYLSPCRLINETYIKL